MRHSHFLFLSLVFIAACATPAGNRTLSTSPPTSLTVVASSDFHGALEGEEVVTLEGERIMAGGAGIFSTYLNILRRRTEGAVVWVDAGDLFQGSMVSNRFEGAPVVRLYNHLGLDAAALGNHEFDYGPAGEKTVPRGPNDDPRGALKARMQEANFPFLAINVRDRAGKSPDWIRGSKVIERSGLKIGVIGATSRGTGSTTIPLNVADLQFLDPQPLVLAEAQRLRQNEKVNAVIVLIHEGGACEVNTVAAQDDLSSCGDGKGIIELAKNLPEGLVDVIVAGHTHRGIAKRVKRTVIMQPFSHGKYLTWASVPLTGADRTPTISGIAPVCERVLKGERGETCDPYQIKKATGRSTPARFLGEAISADPTVAPLIAREMSEVKALKETPLGFSVTDAFMRNFLAESSLGNLIADVTREALPNIDLGLSNAGGLRANINPGPVTYGSVFNVLPFDNQIAVLRIKGDKVVELAKIGLFGKVGVYAWSENLSLVADGCDLKEVKIDGKPIDVNKTYAIATSDFLAWGGSGVSRANIPSSAVEIYWDAGFILRDLTAGVLRRWHRSLTSTDFFRPDAPRQKILKKCEQP